MTDLKTCKRGVFFRDSLRVFPHFIAKGMVKKIIFSYLPGSVGIKRILYNFFTEKWSGYKKFNFFLAGV